MKLKAVFERGSCVVALIGVVACSAAAADSAPGADLAAQILEMTGARTKIVWANRVAGSDNRWGSSSAEWQLMGFDTDDGKKRVILPGPVSYGNPSITQDGSRIVFTDVQAGKVYVVDWDGKNKRFLTTGFGLCTWFDTNTGIEWVYAGKGEFSYPVNRYQLDNPQVKESVWDKVVSCSNGFQISADGTRMGSEFPHPNAGVAMLPNGSWQHYGSGCEGCIAPDNSYRFFHMGESAGHSGVMMYDGGGINKRMVAFTDYPGGRPRQDAWNPRWTTDVRFLTVSSPNSGPAQEVYLGEFDEHFTRILKLIRITDRPGQDLCSHAWIDPGMGYRVGEVPFTVEIPAPKGGNWQWDYGDGTKETAPAGRHTYRKAGRYTITARQGDTVVKGTVQASPAKPPSVVRISFYDEANLALTFDERVQLKDAKLSLESGTPIDGWALDPDGFRLLLKLGGKIGKEDGLRIEGVYDRAQVPKPMAEKVLRVVRPAWPTDRSNIVFLWQDDSKKGFQLDGEKFTTTQMRIRKSARYGPFGEMSLEGGVMFAIAAGGGVQAECSKSNQLTVEAVIRPANIYQGWKDNPRSIMSCGWSGRRDGVNFRLAQERDKLVFYLRQRGTENNRGRVSVERTEVGTLSDQAPSHVIVSYEPGKLACYLNGKQVVQTDAVNGTLAWNRVSSQNGLNFGGAKEWQWKPPYWSVHGTQPTFPVWRGRLEGIAVYSRAIGAEEAAKNFAAYDAVIKARPVAPRVKFRGTLVAKSKLPKAKDIAPYRDALLVYEYDVDKIVAGRYDQKKIRVARWGMIDTKPAAPARAKLGESIELTVEDIAHHPQTEAEVVRDTLEENFDLPLYLDIANGPSGEPRLTSIRIKPYQAWIPPGDKFQYEAVAIDQYRVPLDVPLKWRVIPGGSINTGVYYGGGNHLDHKGDKGGGTIDDTGLFVADGPLGVITIEASGAGDPPVKGTVSAAVDNYPSISPQSSLSLALGANQGGGTPMAGDLDRARIYNRALTGDEIAAHAAGKDLTAKGLIADWTFDKIVNGTFPNEAGDGLDGRIIGEVEQITEGDVGFIRIKGRKSYVKVAPDRRLDFSKSCTLEAWVRPSKVEGLSGSHGIVMDRSRGGAPAGFRLDINNGISAKGMYGREVAWLRASYRYPANTWTHIAAVYDVNGVRKVYIAGKLCAELKRGVLVVIK